MRIRFERFSKGTGYIDAECDLTTKQAKSKFENLKQDGLCGWVELVAEDDSEGGYMEIIDFYENVRAALIFSTLV